MLVTYAGVHDRQRVVLVIEPAAFQHCSALRSLDRSNYPCSARGEGIPAAEARQASQQLASFNVFLPPMHMVLRKMSKSCSFFVSWDKKTDSISSARDQARLQSSQDQPTSNLPNNPCHNSCALTTSTFRIAHASFPVLRCGRFLAPQKENVCTFRGVLGASPMVVRHALPTLPPHQ